MTADTRHASGRPSAARRGGLHGAAIATLVIGLVVTGGLSWLTYVINQRNEDRLLALKVRELGAVFTTVLPDVQSPLASAALVASLTSGSATAFARDIGPDVGAGQLFVSASLWHLTASGAARVATVGAQSQLSPLSAQAQSFFRTAPLSPSISVIGLLAGGSPRLGYEYNTPHGRWAVVGESALPSQHLAPMSPTSPFADLTYALYLGRGTDAAHLLETSTRQLPLTGRTARDVIPFGGTHLTLVARPIGTLGGTLLGDLPWIIAGAGAALTALAVLTAGRLARRRVEAEGLAAENRDLYDEQREIAETLQESLLPRELPRIAGVDLAARYLPGAEGVDVGGDWYSAVAIDDERFAFVVGDVSGRGVRAASVMASLHYTTRAYISLGYAPHRVLEMAARELHVAIEGHFATALVGLADRVRGELTLASAGHLRPLLLTEECAEFVDVPVGVPLGMGPRTYQSTTVPLRARATLVAFTDGLVERRGETIEEGMARLRKCAASAGTAPIDAILTTIVTDLSTPASEDDVALLGMQWLN